MNRASNALIFINQEKPELVFAAAEILLQIPKGTRVIPCTFRDIIDYDLRCEEIYVLEIEPKTEEEKRLLAEFVAKRKKTLKIWSAHNQIFKYNGPEDSVGYVYELKKLGITVPDYLQKRAALIAHGDTSDPQAARIIKALSAQKTIDAQTDASGYLELLGKMLTEVIIDEPNPEINELAEIGWRL